MKSLKISDELHHRCKLAALEGGVKLFQFIEQALLEKLKPNSLLLDDDIVVDEPTDAEKLASGKFFILNGVVTPKKK